MRVGLGHDIRPVDAARPLVIGGHKIEGAWGLRGRGDGDVLLQAVADALLGAAGLGGLGDHLDGAPGDPSAVLLAEAVARVRARGLVPVQVDATLALARPPLGDRRGDMRRRIAELLGLPEEDVNLRLGAHGGVPPVGTGEAGAAWALVQVAAPGAAC